MKAAVIGAGSWGTAIAWMLAEKQATVSLWVRNAETASDIVAQGENLQYLPGVQLQSNLLITTCLEECVDQAELVVLATPSHAIGAILSAAAPFISSRAIVVCAAKGFEIETGRRLSEILEDILPGGHERLAVLSGPNHAEEVGKKFPTASVVAAYCRETACKTQQALSLPYFRIYTNPDVVGVEMGGALKNIIALGAGIAEGLGYGDNTKAALMTRGLAEIRRLAVAKGANSSTFSGLSGVGDLIATCTSRHSRNRNAGMLLAQGYSAEQIAQRTRMVVEGIRATRAAFEMAQKAGISMPITEQIYAVLYHGKDPLAAVKELMLRSHSDELEEIVEANNWDTD